LEIRGWKVPTVEATLRLQRAAFGYYSCVPWTLGFFQPRISNPWLCFGQSKAAEKRFLCAHSLRPLRFPAYCDQVSQCVDADEAALAELNVQLLIIEKGCAQEGGATGCQDTDGAVNHKPKHHLVRRSIDPEKDMAVS